MITSTHFIFQPQMTKKRNPSSQRVPELMYSQEKAPLLGKSSGCFALPSAPSALVLEISPFSHQHGQGSAIHPTNTTDLFIFNS